jgi:hypothetical protein
MLWQFGFGGKNQRGDLNNALARGVSIQIMFGVSVDSPENQTQACRLEFIMFGDSEFQP